MDEGNTTQVSSPAPGRQASENNDPMETAIMVALIGAGATVVAALIGLFANKKRTDEAIGAEDVTGETRPSEDSVSSVPGEPRIPSPAHLSDYAISLLPECEIDRANLGLSQEHLLYLIGQEFENHINYFLYDLEDYVLPVRASFLVYLDKTATKLVLKRILPCTENQAKLISWEDMLALYRRCTRLAYREDPAKIVSVKSMLPTAIQLHTQVEKRITKHFLTFEGIDLRATAKDLEEARPLRRPDSEEELIGRDIDPKVMSREVWIHLEQAATSRTEAKTAIHDLENDLVTTERALSVIVVSLERSLQHLHKILIRFPPTVENR